MISIPISAHKTSFRDEIVADLRALAEQLMRTCDPEDLLTFKMELTIYSPEHTLDA